MTMSVDVELVVSYCFFCFLAENIIVNKLQLYVEMYIQLKELFCKSEKLMAIKLVLYGSLKQFSCNFHKTETVKLTTKGSLLGGYKIFHKPNLISQTASY